MRRLRNDRGHLRPPVTRQPLLLAAPAVRRLALQRRNSPAAHVGEPRAVRSADGAPVRDIAFAAAWIVFSFACLILLAIAAVFLYVTWPVCWLGEAACWLSSRIGNQTEAGELRTTLDQHYTARRSLMEACAGLAHDIAHPFSGN